MSTVQRELLSMRAYAERRGCDVSAVSRQVKRGRISLIDGKIDPEVADVQWARTTRPRSDGGRPTTEAGKIAGGTNPPTNARQDGGDGDYWASRSRREQADAEKSEIELRQLKGSLIDKAGVTMAMETAWRQIRDSVMAVPDRIALEPDTRTLVRDSLRAALTDAQKMMATLMAGEPVQ